MITFAQYLNESMGTYACLKLSQESKDRLHQFMKDTIQSPVDKEDYHCTVVYSHKDVTQAIQSQQPKLPITAKAIGYESFDGGAYVLKIESKELNQLHKETRNLGATYDYPQYNPHITLSYDNKPIEDQKVPDFDLVFDQYHIEELKD